MDGFLVGVQGMINTGNIENQVFCLGNPDYGDQWADCTTKIESLREIAVRLGFAPDDQWLVYAKLGRAYAKTKYTPDMPWSYNDNYGYESTSKTRSGRSLGLGVEHAVSDHMSLAIDYSSMDFGKKTVGFTPEDDDGEYTPYFEAKIKQMLDVLAFRINYTF